MPQATFRAARWDCSSAELVEGEFGSVNEFAGAAARRAALRTNVRAWKKALKIIYVLTRRPKLVFIAGVTVKENMGGAKRSRGSTVEGREPKGSQFKIRNSK